MNACKVPDLEFVDLQVRLETLLARRACSASFQLDRMGDTITLLHLPTRSCFLSQWDGNQYVFTYTPGAVRTVLSCDAAVFQRQAIEHADAWICRLIQDGGREFLPPSSEYSVI